MIDKLQFLIGALREELQQYGEMLARLDYHQDLLMHRRADNLPESVAAIEAQGIVLQQARRERDACRRELSRALRLPDDATFTDISPLLPADYRPLLTALVQENNELLTRVQQRSRQNHLLLARTLEMMQRFISSLFPGTPTPVYNGNGMVLGAATPQRTLYDAVG